MDDVSTSRLLLRFAGETLRTRMTWYIMVVVGTVINLYGQLLIPWLRNAGSPLDIFMSECVNNPGVLTLSVVLGFAFPLVVSVFSGTWARYQGRQLRNRSQFPDAKPDPVFRVDREGHIVDAGERTWTFLEAHGITSAEAILGELAWAWVLQESANEDSASCGRTVVFDGSRYAVTWARVEGQVNVYMARLGDADAPDLEAVA